ncbi:MAG: HAD family hydrolase [Acidimicrobiales bacterium]
MREIDVVVFDVGETLLNEDRAWTAWAQWLGVSPALLFACLGATIALRQDHRLAFQLLVPGFDFEREHAAKEASGNGWHLGEDDLYPDATRCLQELGSAGYRLAIAGNQPLVVEKKIEDLGLGVDFVGSSGRWGLEKPSPAFFERVVDEAGVPADRIVYVGDRLDYDVLPAKAAGMAAVFIRRGPWGLIQSTWPEIDAADATIDSLEELVGLLGMHRTAT